jgi:hypothetical protein
MEFKETAKAGLAPVPKGRAHAPSFYECLGPFFCQMRIYCIALRPRPNGPRAEFRLAEPGVRA